MRHPDSKRGSTARQNTRALRAERRVKAAAQNADHDIGEIIHEIDVALVYDWLLSW